MWCDADAALVLYTSGFEYNVPQSPSLYCTALHISTPFSTVSLQQRGPANQCFHVHFPLRKGNSMCPFTWHILQCMFSFLSHSPLFPIQNKRRITYLYLKGKTKEELGICFSIMTWFDFALTSFLGFSLAYSLCVLASSFVGYCNFCGRQEAILLDLLYDKVMVVVFNSWPFLPCSLPLY